MTQSGWRGTAKSLAAWAVLLVVVAVVFVVLAPAGAVLHLYDRATGQPPRRPLPDETKFWPALGGLARDSAGIAMIPVEVLRGWRGKRRGGS